VKQKVALKDKIKLGPQINEKFNDINSAVEKKISLQNFYLKTVRRQMHLFIDRRLRTCTCF
jgi:hypothetical protein